MNNIQKNINDLNENSNLNMMTINKKLITKKPDKCIFRKNNFFYFLFFFYFLIVCYIIYIHLYMKAKISIYDKKLNDVENIISLSNNNNIIQTYIKE